MIRFEFTEAERRIFAQQEFVPADEWASKHLIVQDGPYKGSPLRLDVSPFLAGPMRAFSSPGMLEVIVCGSLQVGKTLFLYACLAWAMAFRPGVKMLAMPTKESRNRVVERKLRPLLKGSPVLKRLIDKFRKETVQLRDGSSIELPTAESPSQRASITVQDLLVDEEDLYGGSGKSNALEDFKGRTRFEGDFAKIARACQIKGGEESSIWQGVTHEAEVLYCYEVVCPACRRRHLPEVGNIIVPCGEKDPKLIRSRKLARYKCPDCKWQWSDHIRDNAVKDAAAGWYPYRYSPERGFLRLDNPPLNWLQGRWGEPCATPPPKSVGYHMPAILSRMVSLSDLESRRITAEASDDPDVIRQYYNDDLGLPYSPVEVKTDAERILELRENWLPPLVVPNGAVALTCGIDVQKHGFWYLVRAWMPTLGSYIIDYGQLADWDDVHKLIFDTYYPVMGPDGKVPGLLDVDRARMQREEYLAAMAQSTGEVMPIWRAAIDSGGTETEGVFTRTEEVYMWVRVNGAGTAFACKGASREQATNVRWVVRERMPHNGRPILGGVRLYLLDSTKLKILEMSRLLNPESKQPSRLHANCDQVLGDQLSAERLVRKGSKQVWERIRGGNHLFDCLYLSGAAADASWTPSLPHYVLQLQQAERTANEPAPERKKRQRQPKASRW